MDHLKCKGFVGGASPIRDERLEDRAGFKVNYQNLRAQCYYTLAEHTTKRTIGIQTESEEYRQLIAEQLEQIKGRDVEKEGKLKIIAKDEIKEHLGRSPDFADAFIMRMLFKLDRTPLPNIRYL